MNFIISPNNKKKIDFSKIKIVKRQDKKTIIFKKYHETICKEKSKIDELQNISEWDKMKKIANPYELVYTSYNNKRKDSIADYKPISRSFFKLWEIDKKFNIISEDDNFTIANLAEGPGGFMESILLNYKNKNKKLIGITLPPTNKYIPKWNNNLNYNNNVEIIYGNLYNIKDIKSYINKFKKNKACLVTADGGFDYSEDFNKQEVNSFKMIFSEIIISLLILKKGGSLVCKIFDTFTLFSLKIILLLTYFFEDINIYKPNTSRPANSEKYLVCKNFIDNNQKIHLLKVLENMLNIKLDNNESLDLKNLDIDNNFFREINNYNDKYSKRQILFINKIINLINNFDKEDYKKNLKKQISNAIKWCKDNDMKINHKSTFFKKSI